MKVIIDNSNLFAGGGIQVATSFLNDLNFMKTHIEFHVVQSHNSSSQINKSDFSSQFHFYDLSEQESINIWKRIKKVKSVEDAVKPDVIFVTFGPSYHKSRYPKIVGFAMGQILYPNSPYYNKINFLAKLKIKILTSVKNYFFKRNSDVLIYETDDAKNIYSRLSRNKIRGYTVSNTVNNIFLQREKWDSLNIERARFNICYLAANYPHKNIDIIPLVIDEIVKDGRLTSFKFHLSVGKNEVNFEDKYDNYINYLGKISIRQVPSLYLNMDMLFMPTLLEVFSTTYLEAMISGIPIVTSNLSFARDVCHDAAIYIDPLDEEFCAKEIINVYTDSDLKQQLVEKGYYNLKRFGSSLDRTLKYIEIIKITQNNARY